MNPEPVDREDLDGLVLLRLRNAAKGNALSAELKASLIRHVQTFVHDESARCLLVTGEGRFFCAGGDLASLRGGHTAAETSARLKSTHLLARLLIECEKPVIMAVNGVAAGAGFGLALLGDIVLAAEDSSFRPAFPAVGVAADLCLALTLPRAVGAVRARDILLTDRTVRAAEAQQLGFVSRVLPSVELMPAATALGRDLAAGPTRALGLTKSLVSASYELPLPAFLEREVLAQALAFSSQDCLEGVDAFFAKRKPAFTGR